MSWRRYNHSKYLCHKRPDEKRPNKKRPLVLLVGILLLAHGASGVQGQDRPLTAAESVMLALRQSPQARAALYAREVARVQADRDRPVARPTLNATASGTVQGPRVLFPRPDNTEATFLPEDFGRVDLVLEQPLYRAGLGAARKRYAAESAVAEQEYSMTLADLALAVRKAYLNVQRAESGLRAAQDGLDAAQRYQALVQRQITAGVARPVDSDTVQAQVVEAQAGVRRAEGGIKLAHFNFNRMLGRPQDTPFTLEPIAAPPPVPDSPDAAIAIALRSRPELLTLEQNLRAAQAGISLARVQTQPSLGLRGQLTQQTPTALVHENYAAATLELRWSLLDGGKVRQDVREARAQVERLTALQEDAREGISLEVRTAWQKMVDARTQVASAHEQQEGLQKAAQVAEKAYEVGRGSVVQVQEAQREVRTAHGRELDALYALYEAALDFTHAQGQDLTDTLERGKP
jgi:outer membrane protein